MNVYMNRETIQFSELSKGNRLAKIELIKKLEKIKLFWSWSFSKDESRRYFDSCDHAIVSRENS